MVKVDKEAYQAMYGKLEAQSAGAHLCSCACNCSCHCNCACSCSCSCACNCSCHCNCGKFGVDGGVVW